MSSSLLKKSINKTLMLGFALMFCLSISYWHAYAAISRHELYYIGVITLVGSMIIFWLFWRRHYCGKCNKPWVYDLVSAEVIDSMHNKYEGFITIRYAIEWQCKNCMAKKIVYKIKKTKGEKNGI